MSQSPASSNRSGSSSSRPGDRLNETFSDTVSAQELSLSSLEASFWHPSGGAKANLLNIGAILACLPYCNSSLDIQEPTFQAIVRLEADETLPGILLKDGDKLIGLLSRQRFYEVMSRPFSLDIFPRRPLRMLWQSLNIRTLVLSAETPITLAVHKALQRQDTDIYEPIVVHFSAHQYGILNIHTLLLAQNQIHELALAEIITSKKALQAEKDLAQITLQSISDGVITTDVTGRIQEINAAAEKLTGWTKSAAIAADITTVCQFRMANAEPLIPHPVECVLQQKIPISSQQPMVLCHPTQTCDIEYAVSPILGKDKELLGAILVLRDVSQQQALLREIQWQANHDALTGLINRPEFERKLTECITETKQQPVSTPHALIYLDLDRFKAVNDTCGHLAGDELLRQVGTLLQQSLREADLLARLGGDEFGILLYHRELHTAKQVAERIYQAIQNFRFVWEDHIFTIGASIGITDITGAAAANDVLSQADSACYLAKHRGRNQICAYTDLQKDSLSHEPVKWINRITDALAHSRFTLFHQRIVAIQPHLSPKLLWSEILLRLPNIHGDGSSPNTFLPTAERYNLMTEIDAWVVHNFCKHYQSICQSSHSQFFSINLSGASLNNPRLSTFIKTQFESQQVSPRNICFEITETVAITNLTRARSLVQELKQWGCSFALDDFGTGMSSFNYLRSLPVDYLKIDGSLIRDIDHDRAAREMVSAVNKISHEMGLMTVAEWVESDRTLEILQDLQVDYLQGEHLHIPEALLLQRPAPTGPP